MPPSTIGIVNMDILILGSGGAGWLAALHAHDINADVTSFIAVKCLLGRSGHTRMVQGGYNAIFHLSDSPYQSCRDTIEAGACLDDPPCFTPFHRREGRE